MRKHCYEISGKELHPKTWNLTNSECNFLVEYEVIILSRLQYALHETKKLNYCLSKQKNYKNHRYVHKCRAQQLETNN